MRKVKLTSKQADAFEKIAKRSKMDDWFAITEDDGKLSVREADINTLIDGATEYDVETLTPCEFLAVANVLIHCKEIK